MSPFYLPLGPRAPLPITITKFVAAIPRSYPVGPVTTGDSQKDATETDSVARHILVKYSNVTSILLYGVGSQCKSSALAEQPSLETPPLPLALHHRFLRSARPARSEPSTPTADDFI